MRLEYELTFQDHVIKNKYLIYWRGWKSYLTLDIIIFLLYIILFYCIEDSFLLFEFIFIFWLEYIIFNFLRYSVLGFNEEYFLDCFRHWKEIIDFNDENIQLTNMWRDFETIDGKAYDWDWQSFRNFEVTNHAIYLFYSFIKVGLIVPLRAFESDNQKQDFLALIERKMLFSLNKK